VVIRVSVDMIDVQRYWLALPPRETTHLALVSPIPNQSFLVGDVTPVVRRVYGLETLKSLSLILTGSLTESHPTPGVLQGTGNTLKRPFTLGTNKNGLVLL
jgi:hypothetical protein